jgi:hypothetical protein
MPDVSVCQGGAEQLRAAAAAVDRKGDHVEPARTAGYARLGGEQAGGRSDRWVSSGAMLVD